MELLFKIATEVNDNAIPFENMRVYYRVTVFPTRQSLLSEISYPFYDWFRSLD